MREWDISRRDFIERCMAVSTAAMFSAWAAPSPADKQPKTDWKAACRKILSIK